MNISDLVPWRTNKNRVPVRRQERDIDDDLMPQVGRLFDDFFRSFDLAPFGERVGTFTPRVDVTESDNEIRIAAELPGLSQEDVDVTLTRDSLVLKGEKKEEQEEKGRNYYRMERSYGAFSRTIPLPADVVDTDKVDATFKNGVLTITLPKRPEVQQSTKRISVKAG